jgi:hypothetical protein
MNDRNNELDGEKLPDQSREAEPGGKRPYLKPSFRSEKIFERMALSCGKVNPNQFQCRFNRKSS